MYGWQGTILRVNLTSGEITKEPLNNELAHKYVGGRGLNSKLLYDEVKPGIDPLGPDNKLIFGIGPACGTLVPGSQRWTVTCKATLSNFLSDGSHIGMSIDDLSINNTWDNGCEGNYWSNYNGTDTTLPPDGIGDISYVINENNTDRHPLMNRYWNPTDINHDLKVDIRDLATAALAYGSHPGDANWNCHADITGPIPLEPDKQVDMRDIALIAINYGEIYQ